MADFIYYGRDKQGAVRSGKRTAIDLDTLNLELIKEGITPLDIKLITHKLSPTSQCYRWLQLKSLPPNELVVFTRQMQLLHEAGVPIDAALRQLAELTRNQLLSISLKGILDYIAKGQSLAAAMQHFPDIFSPLMISIIQIGETTGHLDKSFAHLHQYLIFEANNSKQIKSAFRYPTMVLLAILSAILTINLFVIPTFAKFYANLSVTLPWQTRFLIGSSNFFIHYFQYIIIAISLMTFLFFYYLKTPSGSRLYGRLSLKMPLFGKLLKQILLIRICQSLALVVDSGIPLNQGLKLVKQIISNTYLIDQLTKIEEAIERGIPFTQASAKFELLSPLEAQILAVGEASGELSPALHYISNFQHQEVEYDLKRLNDFIGPFLIGIVSILILILALGVYLPIWNMIDMVHH
ncbi:MAG: hypothetical protein A3E85_02150 [Gammaproteobacteria bacterium RIFCSPHIGHO2_12_FULL_45_12]|nr:MAG: hypothetical protein A3E85_02150 [Gammaproteobacteria bacterium RIFCSPHIGHO2_12_FULL_45_12]